MLTDADMDIGLNKYDDVKLFFKELKKNERDQLYGYIDEKLNLINEKHIRKDDDDDEDFYSPYKEVLKIPINSTILDESKRKFVNGLIDDENSSYLNILVSRLNAYKFLSNKSDEFKNNLLDYINAYVEEDYDDSKIPELEEKIKDDVDEFKQSANFSYYDEICNSINKEEKKCPDYEQFISFIDETYKTDEIDESGEFKEDILSQVSKEIQKEKIKNQYKKSDNMTESDVKVPEPKVPEPKVPESKVPEVKLSSQQDENIYKYPQNQPTSFVSNDIYDNYMDKKKSLLKDNKSYSGIRNALYRLDDYFNKKKKKEFLPDDASLKNLFEKELKIKLDNAKFLTLKNALLDKSIENEDSIDEKYRYGKGNKDENSLVENEILTEQEKESDVLLHLFLLGESIDDNIDNSFASEYVKRTYPILFNLGIGKDTINKNRRDKVNSEGKVERIKPDYDNKFNNPFIKESLSKMINNDKYYILNKKENKEEIEQKLTEKLNECGLIVTIENNIELYYNALTDYYNINTGKEISKEDINKHIKNIKNLNINPLNIYTNDSEEEKYRKIRNMVHGGENVQNEIVYDYNKIEKECLLDNVLIPENMITKIKDSSTDLISKLTSSKKEESKLPKPIYNFHSNMLKNTVKKLKGSMDQSKGEKGQWRH